MTMPVTIHVPHIEHPAQTVEESAEILNGPPTPVKKVKKEMPPKKEKLKKKVATKRAKKDIEKVTKAGGDDTRPLRASKKPKKEGADKLPNPGPKTKSVRGRNAR